MENKDVTIPMIQLENLGNGNNEQDSKNVRIFTKDQGYYQKIN